MDHEQTIYDIESEKKQILDIAEQSERRAERRLEEARANEASLKDELLAGMRQRDSRMQEVMELVRSQTTARNR